MRASTRVNVTNRLFVTTFLVAFSSVALGSMLPCPAHTLDSDAPLASERQPQKRDSVTNAHRKPQ